MIELLILACLAAPQETPAASGEKASYAVVVSQKTSEDEAWNEVVNALVRKHGASVVKWTDSVEKAREELAKLFPKYACFVARPEEAGREFVVSVHRVTRLLDEDPYTDVLWGILTGYAASDALKIAEHREPLEIRRAAAGCGIDLNAFEEGVWYSEGKKNLMWEKKAGGTPEKKTCPDDTTKDLVEVFNTGKPDFFMTSGHATQRDWQIGFSYRNGQFRCRNGQLFGLDLQRKRHDINSPNPKIYSPAGNCLMGLITDRETMALAWMRSAGVRQMTGYVVSTWFGYAGWGVNTFFLGQAGRFTFAEAFYLNNQALVHQLESRFPRPRRVNINTWNIETDRGLLQELARTHRIRNRDELGLLWDRDTLAFYGDPAWEARLKQLRPLAWKQTLSEKGGVFTFELETMQDGGWGRPPMALLPHRVRDVELVEGKDLKPVITDTFLLIPRSGKFTKGEKLKVVFRARRHAD